jgi:hypothetical protein
MTLPNWVLPVSYTSNCFVKSAPERTNCKQNTFFPISEWLRAPFSLIRSNCKSLAWKSVRATHQESIWRNIQFGQKMDIFFQIHFCGRNAFISPFNAQTMHIIFYTQQHWYVWLKTLYVHWWDSNRVFVFLRRMWRTFKYIFVVNAFISPFNAQTTHI